MIKRLKAIIARLMEKGTPAQWENLSALRTKPLLHFAGGKILGLRLVTLLFKQTGSPVSFAAWRVDKVRGLLIVAATVLGGCIVPPKPEPQVLPPQELKLLVTVNRAQNLALGGRIEEAEAEFRRAIRLAPGRSSLYNDLGYVIDSQSRTVEAIRYYLRALELDRENLSAHTNLARALYKMERFEKALEQYQTAMAIAERLRVEDGAQVQQVFSNRDLASSYQNMAFISATLGLFDQAVCYAEQARRVGDRSFGAAEYARFLLSLARVEPARELLASLVAQQGSDASPSLLVDYGVALWLSHQRDQARQIFEQVALSELDDLETKERLDALTLLTQVEGVDSSVVPSLCDSERSPTAPYWPIIFSKEVERTVGEKCERPRVS